MAQILLRFYREGPMSHRRRLCRDPPLPVARQAMKYDSACHEALVAYTEKTSRLVPYAYTAPLMKGDIMLGCRKRPRGAHRGTAADGCPVAHG